MKNTRDVILVALTIAALAGCTKTEEAATDVSFTSSSASPPSTAAPPSSDPVPAPTPPADSTTMIARAATGSEVVSVSLSSGPRVEFVLGGTTTTLTGESRDTGKRKYFEPSGAQSAEVKPSDTGFKVRTPDGRLLWKVKISEDKIKVSDNEENTNAWSVKTDYPDKAKVVDPSETEVGEVRFAADTSPARVRRAGGADAWTIEGSRGSGAWGVMLMEHVPPAHRAIILAELLARGR